MTDIRVPTLGESITEATVGRWFKQPGEAVAADEPLVELETDKVTLEVPAPAAGTLGDIAAKQGETVAVGAVLGSIKDGAGAAPKSVAGGAPTGRPDTKTDQHDAYQRGRRRAASSGPRRKPKRRRPRLKLRLICRRRRQFESLAPNPASIRQMFRAAACAVR